VLGIDEGYWDALGRWQEVPAETIDAVRASMGTPDGSAPPVWCVRAGHAEALHSPADVTLEDGTALRGIDALPADLPLGYHSLAPLDGGPTTKLVVSPGRCHLPSGLRTWGWALQLYATRSRDSWGIGDLADLRHATEWAAAQGAGVVTVSPLHAPGPASPQQPSPYYPSSRRFRNPLHLRVEDVPGAQDAGIEDLAAIGRSLNDTRAIDRDEVWQLKRTALERAFARFEGSREMDTWLSAQGEPLLQYATYCAIAEVHGNGWTTWPAPLQRPDSPEVHAFADSNAGRVGFHAWLQWLLDVQLGAASAALPVVHDLAVGFDAGGADAWAWQDLLALDMRVGAPPDEFNEAGQDWGLPPFVPWKLRAAGYEPFISTVRSAFRHAGGLRVDHVMGLFRLFWIPLGGELPGTYVRYPASDLLDILALESHRAGALVVGEDLGTVEDDVRRELWERQVLSYRLLWFEPDAPPSWPERALAAVTTHDLPTIAGVWTGADAQADGMRDRLQSRAAVPDDAPVGDAVAGAYRSLAGASSAIVVGTLDDALEVTERPNQPGTTEPTNWSIALPLPLEEIEEDARVQTVAAALQASR
jgi:4-alpha-glucanotransferase